MSDLPARIEYGTRQFDVEELTEEPLELFRRWFSEAVDSGWQEPNGACLCTNDPEGGPDGRIVLLKGYDAEGFSFFTNFKSKKGEQLAVDPRGCMVFWWQPLRRQVRIRGMVQAVSEEESSEYFASRPRGSQLGAWVSEQSRPIADRSALEQRVMDVESRFLGEGVVPRPPHWGGYRLVPQEIEFWQGRDSRLHDRFLYRLEEGGQWSVRRLQP